MAAMSWASEDIPDNASERDRRSDCIVSKSQLRVEFLEIFLSSEGEVKVGKGVNLPLVDNCLDLLVRATGAIG